MDATTTLTAADNQTLAHARYSAHGLQANWPACKAPKTIQRDEEDEKMFTRYKLLIASIGVVLLSACGSGGGGGGGSSTATPASTPTDPNLVFQIFPASLFVNGHTQTAQLSGSDTLGGTYTATFSGTTQPQTTFNSQPAIPVQILIQIKNTKTNAVVTDSAVGYYSTNIGSLMFLGLTDVTQGQTKIGTVINVLPQTAKIGDVGTIGTYSGGTDGRVITEAWQLTNANNGLANLVITASTMTYGVFESSVDETMVIDQAGNRKSMTIKIYLASSNVTMTLSGQ